MWVAIYNIYIYIIFRRLGKKISWKVAPRFLHTARKALKAFYCICYISIICIWKDYEVHHHIDSGLAWQADRVGGPVPALFNPKCFSPNLEKVEETHIGRGNTHRCAVTQIRSLSPVCCGLCLQSRGVLYELYICCMHISLGSLGFCLKHVLVIATSLREASGFTPSAPSGRSIAFAGNASKVADCLAPALHMFLACVRQC